MRYITLIIVFFTIGQVNAQIDKESSIYKELLRSLEKESDTIFIEDRNQLKEIQFVDCNDNYIKFNGAFSSDENVEIELKRKAFVSSQHKIEVIDNMTVKNLIDNEYSYGIDGTEPKFEIEVLTIKINEQQIKIPKTTYSHLFEPHFCGTYLPMKAFESSNGKYIYLYMNGSDGAGGYSVKWIFSRNQYISKIVSTVEFMNGFDFIDGKEE